MLIWFVVIYLLVSVAIGLYAATRVHNTKDFAVAGRCLPLPVVTATVFATWFGAEAVFGVSATFVTDGLRGVVADPFGASLCLVIAGIFYGTTLYRLNVLTLGDFFRLRYNRGGRQARLLLHLRTDVHCLLGDADQPRAVRRPEKPIRNGCCRRWSSNTHRSSRRRSFSVPSSRRS
jgi:Na+(H+)/acetate symporter ActP